MDQNQAVSARTTPERTEGPVHSEARLLTFLMVSVPRLRLGLSERGSAGHREFLPEDDRNSFEITYLPSPVYVLPHQAGWALALSTWGLGNEGGLVVLKDLV